MLVQIFNNGGLVDLGKVNIFLVGSTSLVFVAMILYAIFYFWNKRKFSYHELFFHDNGVGMNDGEAQRHMVNLANHQLVAKKKFRRNFIALIKKHSYRQMKKIRRDLSKIPINIISLVPSAKWLFDNFYLFFKEAKKVHEDSGFHNFMDLPFIINGVRKGYPRIYGLARDMISCTGRNLNEGSIISLLNAYQSAKTLTTAELWAFPSVLKSCLIENINITARDIIRIIGTKAQADIIIKKIMPRLWDSKKNIYNLLRDNIPKEEMHDYTFISHILYELNTISADQSEIEKWLSEEIIVQESGSVSIVSAIIHKEGQFEAKLQLTISSLIISLKELSELNWEEVFEKVSPVEKILSNDPSETYNKMTFETKDNYRHVVEKLAKTHRLEETYVAKKVVEVAEKNKDSEAFRNASHIGTYLIGNRVADFIKYLGKKLTLLEKLKYKYKRFKGIMYFIGLFAFCICLCVLSAVYIFYCPSPSQLWKTLILTAVTVLSTISIGIEVLNYLFTNIIPPRKLLSMDFTEDIPDKDKTFVVMPVILGNVEQINNYMARLEKYYLGNRQNNISFAILGDYKDAPNREMEEDVNIREAAVDAINSLNKKYPFDSPKFNLFWRYRKWNEAEGCWMGWERKRGKLDEFNALISGEENTSYNVLVGDSKKLSEYRFVITIDADTELIRDSASKLIGIMAHPLNRPAFDVKTNRITEGYAIVQSEIRNRINSARACLFSNIFSGQAGIDPYSTVVSDMYNDTFEEGIFVGKGIYDVRAFNKALHKAIPENCVLSHDLLESCYARCAFASGVTLMDSFPASFASYIRREHRWTRGDWQLLPWLFGKGHISGLSKWKLFDNLRRSSTFFFQFILIISNLVLLPGRPFLWMLFVFFTPAFQLFIQIFRTIQERIRHFKSHICYKNFLINCALFIIKGIMSFIFIPYRMSVSFDAIGRSLYRQFISHKKMLEWQTAESVDNNIKNTVSGYIRAMWVSMLLGAILLALLFLHLPVMYKITVTLIAVFWIFAPFTAYYSSKPVKTHKSYILKQEDKKMIRLIARKTWNYFENYTKKETNWLCPDNYQEFPSNRVDNKASPTNIGLELLANLAARDLGYISILSLVVNYEKIFSTILIMEKWHGHLYNWYNTSTLEVLNPRYISTVDSGNFIGYMVTIKNGLRELLDKPVFSKGCIIGLCDTVALANMDFDIAVDEIDTPEKWRELLKCIIEKIGNGSKPWENNRWKKILSSNCSDYLEDIEEILSYGSMIWQDSLNSLAQKGNQAAKNIIERIESIIETIIKIFDETDFKILFNKKRMLFHIGYHISSQTPDACVYDLLASESRQTSFIAIAKGDVPLKHWFKLGRPMNLINHTPILVSWSGTMFEYLMPNLILKSYPSSALTLSCVTAVKQQIKYGEKGKMPWGISESQYFSFDTNSNYQYRAFGVPEIRMQASIQENRVVAPYAAMLALHVLPDQAVKNIRSLKEFSMEGKYGFYESMDYINPNTEAHMRYSMVRSFMLHHQGMSFVSIDNFLNSNVMQNRFHMEPIVQATEVLLEESNPISIISIARQGYTVKAEPREFVPKTYESRVFSGTSLKYPCAHILSNKNYMLMLTTGGSGFSSCSNKMINRWRPEFLGDSFGTFIYVRNSSSKAKWSVSYQPVNVEPDEYLVVFSVDKAEYIRRDGQIKTHTEVAVSPQEDMEVRRVTFFNSGPQTADLEVTSYFELVADSYRTEYLHPAFSKLFYEIEYIPDLNMLIGKKRQRGKKEEQQYVIHMVVVNETIARNVEFETDRKRFIGRKNSLSNPDAMKNDFPLSNKAGHSLDPIMSLRTRVIVADGKTSTVSFITGFCKTRDEAILLAYECGKPFKVNEVFKMANYDSELEMLYLNMNSQQVNAIQDIVGGVFYPSMLFRSDARAISKNKKGQAALWRFGISGDKPIILARVAEIEEIGIVKDALLAYEYLRINCVKIDLVILIEQRGSYNRDLNYMVQDLISNLKVFDKNPTRPSLFVLQSHVMEQDEIDLLLTVARIVFSAKAGIYYWRVRELLQAEKEELSEHIKYGKNAVIKRVGGDSIKKRMLDDVKHNGINPWMSNESKEYFNGIGSFTDCGREYEIVLKNGLKTPSPWINVIANDKFGFIISESGSGYTWATNSRENKLTSWSNDPVCDPPSEVIYIVDEDTGEHCSPAQMPVINKGVYKVRHGYGYSIFEHNSMGIDQNMTVFVPEDQPVKIWLLKLLDKSQTMRRISVTLYVEWVLGESRETAPYVITQMDEENGILMAKNIYKNTSDECCAFIAASESISSFTGNREHFIGRTGSIGEPRGLSVRELNNETGVGLYPCGVIRMNMVLQPDEEKQIVLTLGQCSNRKKAVMLAEKFKNVKTAKKELKKVKSGWDRLLNQIKVKTPDRMVDIMVNGWLLYQVVSCRLRARTAFYQCSGAYGFRDQLQDVMALLHTAPEQARNHILLCCSRQFIQGDVQHWWHPPFGQGVRTKISDDLLWLPYVTARYINTTGDCPVLGEVVNYLNSKELKPDEYELLMVPQVSEESGTVYEHCTRAIDRALNFGKHGLPLMGSGDWNDGMNRVGIEGEGESVWLGWFLYTVLGDIIPICIKQNDLERAEEYRKTAQVLLENIEKSSWDGEWYIRAFLDNGKPLGSKNNDECKIDSISQSWSVISGGADANRAITALKSADRFLVREEDGIIMLLTPPFDKTSIDPGYIKGYYPGVRENGGQYTHAAIWLAIAYAKIGDGNSVYKLLSMMNPIDISSTFKGAMKYEQEPYVVTADIYSCEPNIGRGGWSWYTGAAGWMYQALVFWMLGIKKNGEYLYIDPVIPSDWNEYSVEYTYKTAKYFIQVINPAGLNSGVRSLKVDDMHITGNCFGLKDDGLEHKVIAVIGEDEQLPLA